jgi:hypothetical protein
VRRLLACLIVLIVASTPAADAYCRAACLARAETAPAAEGGGHCALHGASTAGPLMSASDGPCANPHADVRAQQARIKIERGSSSSLPAAVAPRAPLPVEIRAAIEPALDRLAHQALSKRSLPLRR